MALSAAAGVERQFASFEKAAAKLASASGSGEDAAKVSLSAAARAGGDAPAARSAAAGGGGAEGDLGRALVDVRTSKYLAIANLKVLQTADELAESTAKLV